MGPRAVSSGRRDHCLTLVPETFLCPKGRVSKRCLVTFISSASLERFRHFMPSFILPPIIECVLALVSS